MRDAVDELPSMFRRPVWQFYFEGLTQHEISARLDRPQSFIASIETGQRRVDVVELLDLAEAIGFDPHDAVQRLLGAVAD